MPKNPQFTPQLSASMTEMVAEGVYTYLSEYVRGLFPDPRATEVQSCVLDGITAALRRYEADVGKPIAHALAYNLLDNKEPAL